MKEKSNANVSAWKDPDDAPELTGAELDDPEGVGVVGGHFVSPATGRAAFARRLKKQPINLLLDPDIVDYFKAKAGGRGYQTLINQALRHAMEEEELESTLRRVIKEEIGRFSKTS